MLFTMRLQFTLSRIFLLVFFIGNSLLLQAQDGAPYSIATDRPSVSFTAALASKNILIVETGYFRQRDEVEALTSIGITQPNVSLRYGLSDNFELRLGWEYIGAELSGAGLAAQRQEGSGPLTLGAKIKIADNKGWIPQTTFLGAVQLPFTAAKDFQSDFTGSYFRFLFQNTLNERFFVFYNLGANFGSDAEGRAQSTGAYTFALGANVLPNLSAFVEVFGFLPERGIDQHSIDAGLVYVIRNQYQLDASIGYGLNEYAPDMFFNLGFSFYLNFKKP